MPKPRTNGQTLETTDVKEPSVSSNVKRESPPFDPDQPYRDAMRALIGRRWEAVWKSVPVALAGHDIEGVHDVRVASRRLRAAMDVATECFPTRWYAALHRTAKEITGALGDVRDRDVMIEYLTKERANAPADERPGIDHLITRIERERVTAREAMEAFLRNLLDSGAPEETRRRFSAGKREGTSGSSTEGINKAPTMEARR